MIGREHGTYNRYANHGCRCDLCREAAATYRREWRKKSPTKAAANKRASNANYRALWRLADMHRADFEQLRDAERAKVGLPAGRRNVA